MPLFAVVADGNAVGLVAADKVTREELGLMMAGAGVEEKKGEAAIG